MERHSMFIDWKTRYHLYGNSLQIDLWIQYNPYQNPRWDFAKTDKLIPKFIWKGKRLKAVKTVITKNQLERLHFAVLKRAVIDLGEPEIGRVMIAESSIESLLSGSQTSQKNGLYLSKLHCFFLWTGKFPFNFSFHALANK